MISEQVTWNWNQNLNTVFKNWTQGSIFVFWARTTHQWYIHQCWAVLTFSCENRMVPVLTLCCENLIGSLTKHTHTHTHTHTHICWAVRTDQVVKILF
jgi:hypothetical protein